MSLGAASQICDAFCTEEWSETWVRMLLKQCKYRRFLTFQLFGGFLIFVVLGSLLRDILAAFGDLWVPFGWLLASGQLLGKWSISLLGMGWARGA